MTNLVDEGPDSCHSDGDLGGSGGGLCRRHEALLTRRIQETCCHQTTYGFASGFFVVMILPWHTVCC